MNEEKLKYLLDRFYCGTSTPEMENELRQFFASDAPVSDEFKADKAMFQAMNRHCECAVPEDLEKRIIDATIGNHKRRKRLILRISGIAAAVAAIVTLSFFPTQKASAYREITDPEEAYAILCMVDAELQSALAPAQNGLNQLESASEKIQTTINEALSL